MELECRIPSEDYENLGRLIGLDVSELLFEKSFDSDPRSCAHMIALKSPEEGFIRFCTDEWDDTYKEAINCYRFRIECLACPTLSIWNISDKPLDIDKILIPEFKVVTIDVYEFRESESGESVVYDAALLLRDDQRPRLLIGIDNSSIVGDVYLAFHDVEINGRLAGYHYLRSIGK